MPDTSTQPSTSLPPSASTLPSTSPRPWQTRFPQLYAFWKFSRPHTIIGTSLSTIGIFLIAWAEHTAPLSSSADCLPFFCVALFACLCGNVYIVGLNQLYDVEIDRINKPHLPVASGEFSLRQGWTIVLVMGVLALLASAWQGGWLMATVWTSLVIGTAYSAPPIRLKRFPIWASLCIFTVRGAIVNLGLFLFFHSRFSSLTNSPTDFAIPATVWALTLFILVFTFAIAIFKDIPDLEGDRRYQITTFTVRLGAKAVFNIARAVLTVCYSGMMLASGWIAGVNIGFLIVTHLLALLVFWFYSQRVDLSDRASIAQCYQVIWKLFFLEYLVFPVACLLT